MPKKTIEEDVNSFLEKWDCDQLTEFLRDIIPLFELYNVEENNDWVKDKVGDEDETNVRLIRTVYLVSRIADFHSGVLSSIRANFPKLWQRLEMNEK